MADTPTLTLLIDLQAEMRVHVVAPGTDTVHWQAQRDHALSEQLGAPAWQIRRIDGECMMTCPQPVH